MKSATVAFLMFVGVLWSIEVNGQAVPSLGVPELPQGPISENAVDCVNKRFAKIERDNPTLKPWLSDVQKTVETLFDYRKRCDAENDKKISRECVSVWNRQAGVHFLRLGLSLFEQKTESNPLDVLNTFVQDFQACWQR